MARWYRVPNLSIGRWPQVIQSADMNGDGVVDLVAANANNQVTIMRGRGDGTFFPGTSYNTGSDPNHMVLMDFNGDGRNDIATTNYGSETVTVLLANLSGGYNTASVFSVGAVPHGLTGGDYDGDGDIDLAVANHLLRTLTIYINRGDGQFDKGSSYALGVFVENLTSSDLNGDGQLDIIVSGASRSIDVLLGMGGGKFNRSISFPTPNGGMHTVPVDVNRDGILDLATIAFWDNQLYVQTGLPNSLRNDRVVTYGNLDSSKDVDVYSLKVAAGSEFAFDIDAAEFQYPLDAELTILSSSGAVLAANKQAIDRESGLDSVDPYIVRRFSTADTIRIVVASEYGTAGAYRLKVTPTTALKAVGPRVLGVLPENRSFVDSTQQIVFLMESALDATSFTSDAIVVRGAQSGIRSGNAQLDPLDNTLIWTADVPLPIDTYTVTLVSGATGVRDLFGNALDGEIASDFKSTTISGNGVSGGNFVSTFTVQRIDTSPANVTYAAYERDPSNRGRFMLRWDDSLLFKELEKAEFTLRGAGPDGQLDTADDRLQSLDAIYSKVNNAVWPGRSMCLLAVTRITICIASKPCSRIRQVMQQPSTNRSMSVRRCPKQRSLPRPRAHKLG